MRAGRSSAFLAGDPSLLLVEPGEHRRLAVADVATEPHVRQPVGARRGIDPRGRDPQQLSDLGRNQQRVTRTRAPSRKVPEVHLTVHDLYVARAALRPPGNMDPELD